MKAVILAGGYGTRLSEETGVRPKPMVEIGNHPILWHIMKIFSAYGIDEFIICCGYKGDVIKDYFAHYFHQTADVTFDLQTNDAEIHRSRAEPWRVTLVDTGDGTMTGGRLKRVREYIGDETFCFTYGDGVADIDIQQEIQFHRSRDVFATVTAVQPPGRFGAFRLEDGQSKVHTFREKPRGDGAWVNGGFFVLEPEAIGYVDGDETVWEREPMEELARDGKMAAYRHQGFWHPMDTLHDKMELNDIWESGQAPWKIW